MILIENKNLYYISVIAKTAATHKNWNLKKWLNLRLCEKNNEGSQTGPLSYSLNLSLNSLFCLILINYNNIEGGTSNVCIFAFKWLGLRDYVKKMLIIYGDF